MSDGAATELFVFAVPAVARSLRNSVYLFYNFRCSSLFADTLYKIGTGLYSLANIPINLCIQGVLPIKLDSFKISNVYVTGQY